MSHTTVYAAEILDTIAERRDLEQFTGTPIFIHNGVDDELVGWLGCPLPTHGYPCEHMSMGDEGSTACWSATEINRLRCMIDSYAKMFESWAAANNGSGRHMGGPDWLELANELRMERDGV